MEFGALHCTARRPRCGSCPLQARCAAFPDIEGEVSTRRPRPSDGAPIFRYEESNRYYRGRILAQLRDRPDDAADAGIPLRDLGRRLRSDFADEDLPWLTDVVASLRKDGLAVAEERQVYDRGDGEEKPPAELSVRLP